MKTKNRKKGNMKTKIENKTIAKQPESVKPIELKENYKQSDIVAKVNEIINLEDKVAKRDQNFKALRKQYGLKEWDDQQLFVFIKNCEKKRQQLEMAAKDQNLSKNEKENLKKKHQEEILDMMGISKGKKTDKNIDNQDAVFKKITNLLNLHENFDARKMQDFDKMRKEHGLKEINDKQFADLLKNCKKRRDQFEKEKVNPKLGSDEKGNLEKKYQEDVLNLLGVTNSKEKSNIKNNAENIIKNKTELTSKDLPVLRTDKNDKEKAEVKDFLAPIEKKENTKNVLDKFLKQTDQKIEKNGHKELIAEMRVTFRDKYIWKNVGKIIGGSLLMAGSPYLSVVAPVAFSYGLRNVVEGGLSLARWLPSQERKIFNEITKKSYQANEAFNRRIGPEGIKDGILASLADLEEQGQREVQAQMARIEAKQNQIDKFSHNIAKWTGVANLLIGVAPFDLDVNGVTHFVNLASNKFFTESGWAGLLSGNTHMLFEGGSNLAQIAAKMSTIEWITLGGELSASTWALFGVPELMKNKVTPEVRVRISEKIREKILAELSKKGPALNEMSTALSRIPSLTALEPSKKTPEKINLWPGSKFNELNDLHKKYNSPIVEKGDDLHKKNEKAHRKFLEDFQKRYEYFIKLAQNKASKDDINAADYDEYRKSLIKLNEILKIDFLDPKVIEIMGLNKEAFFKKYGVKIKSSATAKVEKKEGKLDWSEVKRETDVMSVGDLHGEIEALRENLLTLGVVSPDKNGKLEWIGQNKKVVMHGDILGDRGWHGLEILKELEELAQQAEKAGGKIEILAGNHDDFFISFLTGKVAAGNADGFESCKQGDYYGLLELGKYIDPKKLTDNGITGNTIGLSMQEKLWNLVEIERENILINMRNDIEGKKILETICNRFKLMEIVDDTLFLHTHPTTKIMQYLESNTNPPNKENLVKVINTLNINYQHSLRELLLDGKVETTDKDYDQLRDIILHTDNRVDYDAKIFDDTLRIMGINLIIHGHDSDCRVSKNDNLPIFSVDNNAFKHYEGLNQKYPGHKEDKRSVIKIAKDNGKIEIAMGLKGKSNERVLAEI